MYISQRRCSKKLECRFRRLVTGTNGDLTVEMAGYGAYIWGNPLFATGRSHVLECRHGKSSLHGYAGVRRAQLTETY